MNFKTWFEKFTKATGETPMQIVFGTSDYVEDDMSGWPIYPNRMYVFDDLPQEFFYKEFDDGYGGNDTPNFCAWSPNYVIFSDNYDGAEDIQWVPRNPIVHKPIRPGGG